MSVLNNPLMQCEEIREVRREVRDYLANSFYVPDPLADSASLITTGIIDVDGVRSLVAFLESTFGVTVEDDEVLPSNLDSIARIAAFVCRKKTSGNPVEEAGDLAIDDLGIGDGSHMADAVELDHLHLG